MSKPKKKRQHKCRKYMPPRNKYRGQLYKCRVCRWKYRDSFGCPKCGNTCMNIRISEKDNK